RFAPARDVGGAPEGPAEGTRRRPAHRRQRQAAQPRFRDRHPERLDGRGRSLPRPADQRRYGRPRRGDMKSQHQGNYWIGTYEVAGDRPQGTLTSVPFKVTHPWASFLVGGGPWPETSVELGRKDTDDVFSRTSGIEKRTCSGSPSICGLTSSAVAARHLRTANPLRRPGGGALQRF